MAKEEKKAPKLRFNGYTNDWEQVKLEKIAAFSKGKDYSKLDLKRKGYPIFLYGQMYTDYRYKIVETSTYASLKKDAVVSNGNEIVIPSSGETSVDIARASWIAQKGIILGSDLNIIRPTSSVHPLFLALSLSNNQVKYNLAKVAQGNSIVHLYNNNLKKVNIYFPNIVEQNKIGNILNSISNCINLHERKCEELALIKKALLQKLFPKKDEVRPEVRYKNFSDVWEQRKLGEVIISEHKGKVKSIMKGGNTNYLETNYLNGGTAQKVDALADVSKDDVLILWDGSKAGTIYHGFEGALGSTLKAYVPKYSGDFLYQILKKNQDKIYQSYRTPNIPHVIKNFTEKFNVSIPTIIEQQEIGDFFKQLDSLITLHQRKLEKLKQLKKFLLQNMFI
ncbi:restriction endonuclease subunit S [Ligilactobacillus salivarius]|uniref:restriction endonuclease subunit S n=5 Tax=Ligilactobacillus salivarius TaxID=1624 RepID=UPI0009DB3E6F|nr:restriction endonuclease subunit S [Ligilactobacillus salivarius]OQR23357.1 restriction endonuclease subunit S [Ligilactobacillus salivarius]